MEPGFCPQYTIDETELYALLSTSPLHSGSTVRADFQLLCFTDEKTGSKS